MFANATLRLHLLAFILVLFCGGFNAHAQTPTHTWQPFNNGLHGADVQDFGFATNGDVVVGTPIGLYHLSKNATRWEATSIHNLVHEITTTPTGSILVSTETGTFRSTDNGKTWIQTFDISVQTHFSIGPDGTVFATEQSSVNDSASYYKSIDDGLTWQALPLINPQGQDQWIVANQENHLFMTTASGLLVSIDSGVTWQTTSYTRPIRFLHLRPDNTLLLGGDNGLWESADEGTTWKQISTEAYSRVEVSSNSEYYAQRSFRSSQESFIAAGMYRFSADGTDSLHILRGINTTVLRVAPNGTLWAGNQLSIMQSSDKGRSWSRLDQGISNIDVVNLLKTPDGNLFALIKTGEHPSYQDFYALYRSSNSGQSWEFVRDSLDRKILTAGNNRDIFATYRGTAWRATPCSNELRPENDLQLIRSTDQGETWQSIPGYGSATDISYSSSHQLAAGFSFTECPFGTLTGDLTISLDGGTTWKPYTRPNGPWGDTNIEKAQAINNVIMLEDNAVLFSVKAQGDAGLAQGGLYRAKPDETIEPIREDFFVEIMERTPDGNLIAAIGIMEPDFPHNFTDQGFYRSTDNGETWSLTYSLPTLYQREMFFGPNGLTFTYTSLGLVHRSTDYGRTWNEVETTDDSPALEDFVFHPDGTIFSTNHNFLFLSEDRGETWKSIMNNFPTSNSPVRWSKGQPQTIELAGDNAVLCGSTGYGLYKLDYTTSIKESRVERSSESLHVVASNNDLQTAQFTLQQAGTVSLKLYDIIGREVLTILNEHRNAGEHQIQFSPSELVTGTYLLVLTTEQLTESVKLYR